MFIPYRAGIRITRIPWATLAVAAVCLLVFWAQERNYQHIVASAQAYCTPDVAADVERAQKDYIHSDAPCWHVLAHTYFAGDPEAHLRWHVEKIKAAGDTVAADALVNRYREFAAQAPRFLTEKLVHYSGSWNPLRLLSSVIAHASWDHVLGNLFFFVAFAMVVETVIGPVLFVLVFLAMALGTGALENLLTVTREGSAALGLSGVVMGMMTLAAYFAPRVKIRFFYFFFLFFGVLSWPLWSVAAWFVSWNIFDYVFNRDWSNVGYAAHLAGAAAGLAFGLALFRDKRHWVAEHLAPDDPPLTAEPSWLSTLNAYAAVPVVGAFVFLYGLFAFVLAIWLVVKFFETFAVQLLIAAPAIAASIQLYRMKQPPPSQWQRYQRAAAALDAHRFEQALRLLKPLAAEGYPRAQLALGRFLAGAPGAYRDEREAVRLIRAAAERGLAEAQYEAGVRHLHAQLFPKDTERAAEWLEKAAAQGLPEAASSLGHLCENLPAGAGKEKAIEWYYRAGVAFHKAGRADDARAMVTAMHGLARRYPLVQDLAAELERLIALKGHPAPAGGK